MPYALDFTDTAVDDIERLIDDLPENRREGALNGVEAECTAFAENPLFHRRVHRAPSFPINFRVRGVGYSWAATYRISIDESTIYITHVFRRPL